MYSKNKNKSRRKDGPPGDAGSTSSSISGARTHEHTGAALHPADLKSLCKRDPQRADPAQRKAIAPTMQGPERRPLPRPGS